MKVFIIHGWTYSLDKWTSLVSILEQQGIEVVQLHVPGLTTTTDHAWDMPGYVAWLKQQLDGETRPIVIGHSNGGRIALNYAVAYPNSLEKLILIDSAGIYHGDIVSKLKRGTFKAVAKLGKPLAKVPLIKKVFYKLIGAKDYYRASEDMKQTMKNMLAADKQLDVSSIAVPVQLIWGADDTATPIADAKKLQARLAHATLDVIPGTGHSPHATHPSEVAAIIMKALKS
ncbi:MAG TPA: alpha/beta hydrolase [Patescibacteria group bacterium]|nr:alpha/beta hydrolase [Patescibacteria group bacterium]